MKRTRSIFFVATLVLACCSAVTAYATTGPSEDPERCSERGSTVHRTVGVVTAPATPARRAVAPVLVLAPTPKPAPIATRKPAPAKPSRVTSRANTPSAPTPGMGILLKMANGASGGEVTWSSGKAADSNNTGASWIL